MAALTPRFLKLATWSSISEMRGDTATTALTQAIFTYYYNCTHHLTFGIRFDVTRVRT